MVGIFYFMRHPSTTAKFPFPSYETFQSSERILLSIQTEDLVNSSESKKPTRSSRFLELESESALILLTKSTLATTTPPKCQK